LAILAALGLQAFGLKRRSRLLVLTTRLFSRSLIGLNRPIGVILFGGIAVFFMFFGMHENVVAVRIQTALMDASVPIVDGISRPFQAIASWGKLMQTQASLQAEIKQLQEQNTYMMKWQHAALRYKNENLRLRKLLNVIGDPRMSFVTARVIINRPDSFHKNFTISANRQQGVNKDQAVLTAAGVVGRIIDVGSATARVLLVTDINSRIPVQIESSGEHAILAGDNTHELKLIHLKKPFKVSSNDRLITSGSGGIFPPGLLVATVTSVNGDTVLAKPVVDGDALDFVLVINNRNRDSSETTLAQTPTSYCNG